MDHKGPRDILEHICARHRRGVFRTLSRNSIRSHSQYRHIGGLLLRDHRNMAVSGLYGCTVDRDRHDRLAHKDVGTFLGVVSSDHRTVHSCVGGDPGRVLDPPLSHTSTRTAKAAAPLAGCIPDTSIVVAEEARRQREPAESVWSLRSSPSV